MSTINISPVFPFPVPVLTAPPTVSVLVPVTEQAEALEQFYEEYAAPFRASETAFEFLFLVEPWAHSRTRPLLRLIEAGEPIRILEVGQTVAQSTLLQAGAFHAHAPIVLTLPSWYRVDAASLPELVSAVDENTDIVVARRWPRRDSWFNRLQNRIFHSLFVGLARNRVQDVACGVRAMRREVLQSLPLYGDFHRFLPLFALREGYRVREIDAPQHPEDIRSKLFSPLLYLRRLIDLLGLYFLLYFTDKPLRFFGTVGSAISGVGALLLMLLLIERLAGQALADRPLLVVSVLLIVLGFQSIALGLIGEIVVHLHAPSRRTYRLAQLNGQAAESGHTAVQSKQVTPTTREARSQTAL